MSIARSALMRRGPLFAATLTFALLTSPVHAARSSQDLPAPEAWAALERGDAEKAAAIFREELERSPSNAALNYGAGYASFTLGRTDAAISYLKHAVESNPRFVQALVLLAQIAYQAADLNLAVSTLERPPPSRRAIARLRSSSNGGEVNRHCTIASRRDRRPGSPCFSKVRKKR